MRAEQSFLFSVLQAPAAIDTAPSTWRLHTITSLKDASLTAIGLVCSYLTSKQKKKKIKDINKKLNAAAYASLSQRKINPSGELRQKKKWIHSSDRNL